jgi:histidinol-phosphate phosphatase family protein
LVDVVVPTIGRPSLLGLLCGLAASTGPLPRKVFVVDDRPGAPHTTPPLLAVGDLPAPLYARIAVLHSGGRGPAAARNLGWRAAGAPWVAFVDDDVLVGPSWTTRLVDDLAAAPAHVGGVQGGIRVPLPVDRRPTDWERNVAGLEQAQWATADMAYRRAVLAEVGGFDERFPRAYREDADLALRVQRAGYELTVGGRHVAHPVRPADRWVSVRAQRGNADDVLMAALHGRHWAGRRQGRRARHLATTAGAATAAVGFLTGRRRLAAAGAAVWAAGTAELATARIRPGPRTAAEVGTMLATSAALPPAATWRWMAGLARRRSLLDDVIRAPRPDRRRPPAAVLFDRDGTLVVDVPYNGDPALVQPVPGAASALDRLRAARVPTGVVSNQSGVARALLAPHQVDAVNRRVDEVVGPVDVWLFCPHGPDDECGCRKPAPGLIVQAAARLGVAPSSVAVVGDIGADVDAAAAAGARGVLVPTPATRDEEVVAAREVAPDLPAAVAMLLNGAGS